jgi:hypothetical protein
VPAATRQERVDKHQPRAAAIAFASSVLPQ